MKTAIDHKDFDKQTALYSLRRVYWHNVFRIHELENFDWISEARKGAKIQILKDLNEWVLNQIKGVQKL
jgi:hypothetical protein